VQFQAKYSQKNDNKPFVTPYKRVFHELLTKTWRHCVKIKIFKHSNETLETAELVKQPLTLLPLKQYLQQLFHANTRTKSTVSYTVSPYIATGMCFLYDSVGIKNW